VDSALLISWLSAAVANFCPSGLNAKEYTPALLGMLKAIGFIAD
jgi:hypothetical protein